jgi:hypothetical protein
MEVSRKGEVGVFVGLVVGLVNYGGVIISVVERKLRELDRSQNQEERETFERVAKPVTPERMRP